MCVLIEIFAPLDSRLYDSDSGRREFTAGRDKHFNKIKSSEAKSHIQRNLTYDRGDRTNLGLKNEVINKWCSHSLLPI